MCKNAYRLNKLSYTMTFISNLIERKKKYTWAITNWKPLRLLMTFTSSSWAIPCSTENFPESTICSWFSRYPRTASSAICLTFFLLLRVYSGSCLLFLGAKLKSENQVWVLGDCVSNLIAEPLRIFVNNQSPSSMKVTRFFMQYLILQYKNYITQKW